MKVTVAPLEKKDAGRGIAALNKADMFDLGLDKGDYVQIVGDDGSIAVGTVYPSDSRYDSSAGVIHIDGAIREQANVSIDDTVSIETVDLDVADEIKVTVPTELNIDHDNVESYILNKLEGKAVQSKKTIRLASSIGNDTSKFPVYIRNTSSSGISEVGSSTDIDVEFETLKSMTGGDKVNYEDLGGVDEELEKVREMIELPMRHPELFEQIGVDAPRGVLLEGPPGTGKTMIARAVANETDVNFLSVSGPEIMGQYQGQSEERIRKVFESAAEKSPSLIFFDEIDAIAGKRDDSDGDAEQRVVAQLLTEMDGIDDRGQIMVIAATNRADTLDPALRRGGRFDREIEIGVPDKDGRKEIMEIHTRDMPLADDVDLDMYADNTQGFVGADIASLSKEAAMIALRRLRPKVDIDQLTLTTQALEQIDVRDEDFREALKEVEPSAMREVFSEVPDVNWDDIGGLQETKNQIREMIQWPLDHPHAFEEMGIEAGKGVLLYGPPGTGKTMLAKAVANETNTNFISVKGPELMNKFVGESAKGVREVFRKARENAPTVIFFDEIDSMAGERSNSEFEASSSERVVSQLLTEMDGLDDLEDVVVVAATNRPDMIDSALMRTGRFDRKIHVPVPDIEARKAVFDVHTDDTPLADDVSLQWLANQTEGYVGADVEGICRQAAMKALREYRTSGGDMDNIDKNVVVTREHFTDTIDETAKSVSEDAKNKYKNFEEDYEGNQTMGGDDGGIYSSV